MYPGIELRTMRYIVAVGDELHFTRAAETVRVAQPSLSKQIRNVERAWNKSRLVATLIGES